MCEGGLGAPACVTMAPGFSVLCRDLRSLALSASFETHPPRLLVFRLLFLLRNKWLLISNCVKVTKMWYSQTEKAPLPPLCDVTQRKQLGDHVTSWDRARHQGCHVPGYLLLLLLLFCVLLLFNVSRVC